MQDREFALAALGAACSTVHECPRAGPATGLEEPAPAVARADAPLEPTRWLTLELLPPPGGADAEGRVLKLGLVERDAGRSWEAARASWLARSPAGGGERRGIEPRSIPGERGELIVDLLPVGHDLGRRLVLAHDDQGSWTGRWEHITFAGPVAGGRTCWAKPGSCPTDSPRRASLRAGDGDGAACKGLPRAVDAA